MECNDNKSRDRVKERYFRFFLPICCLRDMCVSFVARVCLCVILFGGLRKKKRRGTSCVVKVYVVSKVYVKI